MTTESPRYDGPERRSHPHIPEDQVEAIAERAAEIAIEKVTSQVYQSVGRTVVHRFIWTVGALAVAALAWARKEGWL